MEQINNQTKISQIIETLFKKGHCEFNKNDFKDEEAKLKCEIL